MPKVAKAKKVTRRPRTDDSQTALSAQSENSPGDRSCTDDMAALLAEFKNFRTELHQQFTIPGAAASFWMRKWFWVKRNAWLLAVTTAAAVIATLILQHL